MVGGRRSERLLPAKMAAGMGSGGRESAAGSPTVGGGGVEVGLPMHPCTCPVHSAMRKGKKKGEIPLITSTN